MEIFDTQFIIEISLKNATLTREVNAGSLKYMLEIFAFKIPAAFSRKFNLEMKLLTFILITALSLNFSISGPKPNDCHQNLYPCTIS